MKLPDFKLERYFAQWEFVAPYILCASDMQGYPLNDLLSLADDECRHLWHNLTLGYTESAGHPLLRQAIASTYDTIEPDKVLTFAGAEEAIFAVMNVLLEPGDHAIVVWPGYQSLYEIAWATGATVTLLPLQAEHNWKLNLEALHRALQPTTRLIVTNFPHNPTGTLPDRQTFDALTALVQDAQVTWFSDEVYRLLEHDASEQLPSAVDCSPHALSLGVMSKAFGMAGLRIGWIATHNTDLLQKLAAFKDYTTICNSAPGEVLAIIALRARAQVLVRNHAIIAQNLPLLDSFFARWSAVFTWVRPRAGCIGFPQLLADVPIAQFATHLVEQEGVMLLPGSVYDHPGNHFRIGFGRTSMPTALARLERFVAHYLPR